MKKPIDLNQIRRQNNESRYKSIEEALDDIQLCWDNCKLYNSAKSEVYQQAISLQKQFWNLVEDNFPEIYDQAKDNMKEENIMAQPASHSMSMQEEQSVEGGAPDSKIEERN